MDNAARCQPLAIGSKLPMGGRRHVVRSTNACMTTYHARSAKKKSTAPASAAMRYLNSELHRLLGDVIMDPSDNDSYSRIDSIAYVIWEYCTVNAVTPWGWCLDRYCSCKLVLSEHEPDVLPIILADPLLRGMLDRHIDERTGFEGSAGVPAD